MKIDRIIELLETVDYRFSGAAFDAIQIPFDIKPVDFLEFAERDLASNSLHKEINALSNAKRALDGQLDCLLISFGLFKKAQKENWKFPKKIETIKEIGIIAPRVLSKLNTRRNIMEHEFSRPTLDEVENFIDIVSLFFAATDIYIYKSILEISFSVYTDNLNPLYLKYNGSIVKDDGIKIDVREHEDENVIESKFILTTSDKEYLIFLKWLLKAGRRF